MRRVLNVIAGAAALAAVVAAGIVIRFARALVTPPPAVRRRITGAREPLLLTDDDRFGDWFYRGPEELGVPWRDVTIRGELGEMPAWHIAPARASNHWVIHVHGRTAQRAETLRGVAAVSHAGWQSLVVSYRNDRDAPASVDGRYGLGSTEWCDVDAAIAYATAHGASSVVLFGWSMGAMISLRAAVERHAQHVDGFIFDSPALSWPDVIAHHATLLRLPAVFGTTVTMLLQSRFAPALTRLARPLNWRELDGGNLAARARRPILLLHSIDDPYVPIGPSRRLAADLPELVELHEFAAADHVRLWNQEPDRWDALIADWLAQF